MIIVIHTKLFVQYVWFICFYCTEDISLPNDFLELDKILFVFVSLLAF